MYEIERFVIDLSLACVEEVLAAHSMRTPCVPFDQNQEKWARTSLLDRFPGRLSLADYLHRQGQQGRRQTFLLWPYRNVFGAIDEDFLSSAPNTTLDVALGIGDRELILLDRSQSS